MSNVITSGGEVKHLEATSITNGFNIARFCLPLKHSGPTIVTIAQYPPYDYMFITKYFFLYVAFCILRYHFYLCDHLMLVAVFNTDRF